MYDAHTGLVRFGARVYDPDAGRWIRKDPALFTGGLNLYQCSPGDPVNYIDVDGRLPVIRIVIGLVATDSVVIGMDAAAPSDTAQAPASVLGMALAVTPLKGLPSLSLVYRSGASPAILAQIAEGKSIQAGVQALNQAGATQQQAAQVLEQIVATRTENSSERPPSASPLAFH